ncbi:MAG: LysR family transcriptional regulator [Gammaproteobacteria bacterium]|nr:LysR family transcriptional regulator [Gammaproteobacteria bacterium]
MAKFSPTIRQLQVFNAVANARSFTRASEILYLSQPAVSLQIKQLESLVGLPLFERLGNKVHLTEVGREIQVCSQTIEQVLADTEQAVDALKGFQRGRLDISVATTAAYFISRVFADFALIYPEISVSLDVTNRESLLQQLDANKPDIVVMGEPPANKELRSQAFKENPLVIVAKETHFLAGQSAIPINELHHQPFVTREAGSGTRATIQRFLEAHDVTLNFIMEITSNEAIKQAVQAGLGLGIVSAQSVELEVSSGCLTILDVVGFPLVRHWYIVSRSGKQLSPVAQLFESFLLKDIEGKG